MLREGWDVQNVTVVVGLRPYTAKANHAFVSLQGSLRPPPSLSPV
jgi:hypothetical protein